jgi:hypothetical protein
MESLGTLIQIAYTVIGPIVVLVGAGYLVGRRVPASAEVLAKIMLYLLVPVFVFQNILASSLGGHECGLIVIFSALALVVFLAMSWGASRLRRQDPALRGSFINSAILYNSANFAIPVMALAYSSFDPDTMAYAVAIQAIVAACQGFAAYTVGALIAAGGSGPVRHTMAKALRLPLIYALVAAMLLLRLGVNARTLESVTVLWKPVMLICGAYVPVALMALGAQMACVRLLRAPVDLILSLVLRLAAGPLVGLALVKMMGLEGLLAQVLIIGISGPSAVASVVLAIEFKNRRADFASSAIFLSTLGAGVTVPAVIFFVLTYL